jgi:putative phosphoesterase
MKYLIISDLHIPERAKNISKEVLEEAKRVDGIICSGDFTEKCIFDKLKQANKNLIAVKGNCDRFNLTEYAEILELGKKIGVIHSHQFGRGNIDFLEEFAKSRRLDILVFGHTHIPLIEKRGGLLLINPGSASGISSGREECSKKTYAVLELNEGAEPKAMIELID